MKTKFYKYECSKCTIGTIETSKNHGSIRFGTGCSRCNCKSFVLMGER